MISSHVIDADQEVNQMIDEEKVDLDLVAGQEIEIEVEKNPETEAKNHEKMILQEIDDHDREMIESQIAIDDHDLVLEKEKLKMKHLWIHFVLLIKQLKMTKGSDSNIIATKDSKTIDHMIIRVFNIENMYFVCSYTNTLSFPRENLALEFDVEAILISEAELTMVPLIKNIYIIEIKKPSASESITLVFKFFIVF